MSAVQARLSVSYTSANDVPASSNALGSCFLPLRRQGLAAEAKVRLSHGARTKPRLSVRSSVIKDDGDRWWEKDIPPNMHDLHSTQEFVEALSMAGDKLVVIDFYGTWCGACRGLFPKLCKMAREYPEAIFYKVNFDQNKPLCKSLNIRVLPFFHFYRGADGRLDAFSASITKIQKLKDALAAHSTDRCSLGPPSGPDEVLQLTAATAPPAASPAATAASPSA